MKYVRVGAGLVISAVFLVLAFRGVHVRQVGKALGDAEYLWLVPAIGAIVASIGLRAVRWRLLFYPRAGLRLGSVFGTMNVGYLVNDLLPLRLGEVVRAYLLHQVEGVTTAHALSTVAVERVLDLVVTLLFLAVVMPFVSLPAGFNGPAVAIVAAVAVTALAFMLLAGTRQEQVHRLGRLVTRRLPAPLAERLHELLDSVLGGFAVLSHPLIALRVAWLSAAIWLLAAAGLYFTMFAFHLNLAPSAPIFVLALVSLSFVVPASPGYVGVFEWTVKTALAAFSVREVDATSYALVAHVVAFVPPMLLGAVYLVRSGTSWDRVFAFRRQTEAPAAE